MAVLRSSVMKHWLQDGAIMSIKNLSSAICAAAVLSIAPQNSFAQNGEPCAGSPWWADTNVSFSDFDFWVGEWHVYDTKSNELRGFDEIGKTLSGCAIMQHWRQMDDLFSPPGAIRRLQGRSLTGITAAGVWRQIWTDNGGGNLVFTGGYDEDGVMTLTSEWYAVPVQDNKTRTIRNIWHWKPVNENEIHNWGFVQFDDKDGDSSKYFDITYRRSAMGGPAAKAR